MATNEEALDGCRLGDKSSFSMHKTVPEITHHIEMGETEVLQDYIKNG